VRYSEDGSTEYSFYLILHFGSTDFLVEGCGVGFVGRIHDGGLMGRLCRLGCQVRLCEAIKS
jgi:hypothetical protein